MNKLQRLPILGLAGLLAMASSAYGQATPYIGYVYPAGGQQGTTFSVKLGGQRLDGVDQVLVTGTGVSAKVVEYFRKMGNQEMTLLREQLKELKRNPKGAAKPDKTKPDKTKPGKAKPSQAKPGKANADAAKAGKSNLDKAKRKLIAKIEKRMAAYCNRPACAALSALVFVEVTIAPDAEPGARELRLVTSRGVSNPLVFHVGQVPEVARKPMRISPMQVLGKEAFAQRKRPPEEVEASITVPCTVNGQIASGEVNWYRFEARKGQRLVLSAAARQLIPYIADAVPGWFQPVLAVYDANGKELAYNDDFRFQPDPTLLFEVPQDGEYRFSITDAIYRGREDFVYRVTIGELPFVTSIFPLGGRAGAEVRIEMKGWNLEQAELTTPATDAGPGVYQVFASTSGLVSNRVPFALDTLPEGLDQESNNDPSHAQQVKLPIIVNGRIDVQDDWDVFQVAGRAGDKIVAEVNARRLDSPLDSMLKLTDETGKLLALNDDREDVASGLNTHHADSYLMVELPADGIYYVHLGDTARNGGEAYSYRLRISAPQPDFALRITPSSAAVRSKGGAPLSVYAIRKDGFTGDIKLGLKDPPEGFSSFGVSLPASKGMVRLAVKTSLADTKQPVRLTVEGRAMIEQQEVAREAVPAEDRMQAFLWRHLVPAEELPALVYNPSYRPTPKRAAPPPAAAPKETAADEKPAAGKPAAETKPNAKPNAKPKPKFTKKQVAGRLRQLQRLYQEWLLTDKFYARKAAELEAAY